MNIFFKIERLYNLINHYAFSKRKVYVDKVEDNLKNETLLLLKTKDMFRKLTGI